MIHLYFSTQIFTGRISAGALHPGLGATVHKREAPVGQSENEDRRCIKYQMGVGGGGGVKVVLKFILAWRR